MIKPSTKVYRKQIVEGYAVPAIIHNMNYFFTDLDVYENGRVQCWNFEDFDHFVQDVKRGWVTPTIPDCQSISIHGLGNWTTSDGKWLYNKESFIAYIQDLIKDLNPDLINIYEYNQKKVNGVSVGENGDGIIYKELKKTPTDFFPERKDGTSINLFYKNDSKYYLARVSVFSDDTIQLSRLETTVEINLPELERLVEEKIILTEVPVGSVVQIYGLGEFTIKAAFGYSNIHDKVLELKDMLKQLKGEPAALEICRQAYETYMDNPTIQNKQELKIAYENVPTHQRVYVGDMDTKDIAVRMIIYGEQEIENWSHYRLSKELGKQLPSIKIPKPKDE